MRYATHRFLIGLLLAAGFIIATSNQAAAGGCNLDGGGGIDCTINSGLFDVTYTQPTGTGVIDSFLRVQMSGTEEAFNTDARPIMCNGSQCEDYKTDPNYTRNLLTSTIPITTINGKDYLTFYLDINEQNAGTKKYLTLDQLKIYGSDTADLSSYTSGGGVLGATQLFNLDTGGDNWINLDYSLVGGGSGAGDMIAYIPVSNALNYDYIYLYSQFGCVGLSNCASTGTMQQNKRYASGAGFEEWWVPKTQGGGGGGGLDPVPEPGTLVLMATGLAVAARKRRKGAASSPTR